MPRLLDLFCGEGGAATGYHDAGFEVVGVDLHDKSKRFPFEFIQTDAVEYLAEHGHEFDAIHASPPCQGYSVTRFTHSVQYPLLVEPIRDLLNASGKPYVIENVPGAPMIDPVILCGSMFPGLRAIDLDGEELVLRRHRLFETNFPLEEPAHVHDDTRVGGVYGGGPWQRDKNKGRSGYTPTLAVREQLMGGITWMTRRGLNESIPPVYAEYVGARLLEVI